MQAIEIQATVKDGILQIPQLPAPLTDGNVKVIVLYEPQPETPQRNYDPKKMEAAFKAIAEKDIFSDIKDPVAWQRQQREEWE
ncbi:MAG: hypothetical protein LH606_22680 [Cytophagaceae bacterium]|nr:hypothetical protein [Cytophagaceae bacterium]